jgi:hypothetical protein
VAEVEQAGRRGREASNVRGVHAFDDSEGSESASQRVSVGAELTGYPPPPRNLSLKAFMGNGLGLDLVHFRSGLVPDGPDSYGSGCERTYCGRGPGSCPGNLS